MSNMEEEKKEQVEKKEKKKNKKNIFGIILFVILIILLVIPSRQSTILKKSSYNKIEDICELGTLKLYYHQTGTYEASGKILNIGYKKYWIEYNGTVKMGINCKNIKVKRNIFGKTIVTIPKAEVLSVDADEESMNELSDTGLFTKISSSDKEAARENAQKSLRENAEKDEDNLQLAQKNVEKYIRSYIEDTDKFYNMFHKVEFAYE